MWPPRALVGRVALPAHGTLLPHTGATLTNFSTHACTLMHEVQVVPLEVLPSLRSLSSVQLLASSQHEHKPWQQHSTSLQSKNGAVLQPQGSHASKNPCVAKSLKNNWDRSLVRKGPWALPTILGEEEQHWYLRRACFSPGVPPGRTTGSASVLMVSQLAPGQQQEGPRDTLDPYFFI